MSLDEIQELIKFVARSGVTEVELELKDFKIVIKTPSRKKRGNDVQDEPIIVQTQIPIATIPQTQQIIAVPVEGKSTIVTETEKKKEEESKYSQIKYPMIGTFYSA